ncbi:WD repeat-containing protein C2orf44-like [Scleropages formosus]|uniref:WD repeat and coiled-coil-containing protein n=1 Tax=Scleropages formosus TaxID=113540 RepID=A0A0N8K1I5_SCLFO|nr:WD repeat-containing protein C2orf44-like [Scleropages formosus]
MDLGKVKLLRTGLNSLHQAIHPVHGIAWTDGKQVCLTSFFFASGEARFGDTNVIGQFEHVFGLYWGPLCCTGSPALLAVQHKKHVTVWQLQLSALEQNKLLCTQTCEMSEPFPLLSQGCVWHPRMDILTILTKRDASVLFSVRVDNRRVKADIKGSGLIHCACWTKDGTRLVVAVGSSLHSYIWNDIQKSLTACTFCPIFDVGGYICAIESIEGSQIAVATELPLDKICGLNAGMAFDVSSDTESLPPQSPMLILGDDFSSDSRRRSTDSERSLPLGYLSSSAGGPIDLTHILAKHRKSDPSPLIHLRRRDHLTGSGQDSSYLILVRYERKVTTTRKVSVPGILVPDIIAFDPRGCTVVVASNTCNMVLVYCVTASSIPNIQQIQLEKNERPKGVCFLSDNMLLLMVGRQKSNDPAFLPSSNTDKYSIRLMTKELINDEDRRVLSTQNHDVGSHFLGSTRRYSESYVKEERPVMKELMLPTGSVIQSPNNRRKLIEEVKSSDPSPVASLTDFSERATSSTSSITIENFDVEHINRMASLAVTAQSSRESSRPCSPRFEVSEKLHSDPTLPKSGFLAKEKSAEQLSQNMERLFSRFAEVQQCLSEIRDFTQNGRKLMGNYPLASEPPYVNVTFQKQLSENVFIDERRPVLLCDGKLCLRVLQDLFGLAVVEMLHGPLWIVLVADADGFVPLTFKPRDEVTLRNGKQKLSARTPCSADGFRSGSPGCLSPDG